jgi:hypothetical protein
MHLLRKVPKAPAPGEPLRHPDHPRPVTRRQLISQGFLGGSAVVIAPAMVASMLRPDLVQAGLAIPMTQDLDPATCGISNGAGKIPFICFDLSGGANIAGSNVIVGGQGGQMDFISSAGYTVLGLPGDMLPNSPNKASATNNFIDSSFGLAFHSDSAVLRGMKTRTTSAATSANTNGVVIPAMSSTDTSTNPHNPMYGIWRAGANGQLLTLIGSEASVSGGNSVAPSYMIDLSVLPTKVSQPSDVTGLVNTGQLGTLFPNPAQAVEVLESMARITNMKNQQVNTLLGANQDAAAKEFLRCQYVKSAYLADEFSNPGELDPSQDPNIVGASGIFTAAEFQTNGNFQKTASVMKMVVDGYAGAGTIQIGGYDYHTGERATGESMDFLAGQCIGACLEYAQRAGKPLMVYVFSDGSLASNGMIDNSVGGRGKCVWTADNASTAASYFLVYNPNGRAVLNDGLAGLTAAQHQQIGFFQGNGSVDGTSSPASNAVNLLCETVILNYMALHGEQGNFMNVIPQTGLTTTALQESVTSFAPIVNGVIS